MVEIVGRPLFANVRATILLIGQIFDRPKQKCYNPDQTARSMSKAYKLTTCVIDKILISTSLDKNFIRLQLERASQN
jgi:hypothetical protein